MQILMVVFPFFVLDRKYPFRANLVQKFKIVCLCWNLALRLIRIWRIQWWCWLFCFRHFLQVFSKKFICHFNVTWSVSQQLKPVTFFVSFKIWKISKLAIIVSRTCPSFWFPWLSALVCKIKDCVQTVICY